MGRVDNIFAGVRPPEGTEEFDTLLSATFGPGGRLRLERIVSHGVCGGEWYDQAWDEWVMVARGTATLEWADGSTVELHAGDHLRIEPHRVHRVVQTSEDCVWIALHWDGLERSESLDGGDGGK